MMVDRILGISSPIRGLSASLLGIISTMICGLAWAQEQMLPETVVTATRVEIPLEQAGSSVTVITAEEL